jgi:hypothetical protein
MRSIRRYFVAISVTFTIVFAAVLACALFAPFTFNAMINSVRNAGMQVYVLVLGATPVPVLEIVPLKVTVTAIGRVQREMGAFSLLYGEGAEVQGSVTVSLGGDIEKNQFGILACDVDTSTIRTSVGRAPFAGTAFDSEQIEQEAYNVFKAEAARIALTDFWDDARRRWNDEVVSRGINVDIPEVPNLTQCPAAESNLNPTATP